MLNVKLHACTACIAPVLAHGALPYNVLYVFDDHHHESHTIDGCSTRTSFCSSICCTNLHQQWRSFRCQNAGVLLERQLVFPLTNAEAQSKQAKLDLSLSVSCALM